MFNRKITGFLLSAMLGAVVFFAGTEAVSASDTDVVVTDETFQGENLYSSEVITAVDENGNVYECTEEFIEVESANPYARAISPLLVNFRTKSSYETTSYTEYSTGIAGYTSGVYGADALYLGMENGKVKFMLAGVIGLVDSSDVQLVSFSSAASYSYYMVNSSNRLIHYITTNIGGTSYGSRLDNGPAPSYLKAGVKYLSYDGHYFYTADKYAVMQSDCNAGHRNNSVNASNMFYNYFQYLPLRSYSDYTGAELAKAIHTYTSSSSKMNNLGEVFVTNQDKYGTNALLVAAIAANESAWGSSNICKNKNNLFGINAIDSSPGASANTFASPQACVKDYTETYLSKRYCRPEYKYYNGAFLGNKASGINLKYASDPYWGEKAAAIAWKLDGVNGGQDAYKYTIGIKDIISTHHNNLNVYKEASASSTVVHKTGVQSGQAFLLMDSEPVNGYYRIQSNGVLNSTRTAIDTTTGLYRDFQMYLYISANYISIASEAKDSHEVEYNAHVSEIGWQSERADGEIAGTTGKALPVEAISIRIDSIEGLGVTYRTHVRNVGWQTSVSDGAVAGTTGRALSIEAIEIDLTGENAFKYDIYYSAHVANVGWLGWAKNGAPAGSSGYAYPIESIKIQVVEKGAAAPGSTDMPYIEKNSSNPVIRYEAHLSNVGWMGFVQNGETAGKVTTSYGMEAYRVKLDGAQNLSINYKSYVQGRGWQDNVTVGNVSGTTGQARYIEAVAMSLSGSNSYSYNLYYRSYVKGLGWLGWAKNGETSGTRGYDAPITAIQIKLVKAGGSAPGSSENAYMVRETKLPSVIYAAHVSEIGWMDAVADGELAGTTGKRLALEAIKINVESAADLQVSYATHVKNIGWMDAVKDGDISGTTGKALSVEAIRISLSGADATLYDIYYRAHVSNLGWLGWAKNGESAGSAGYAYPMEAIEICIVAKGDVAPGSTELPFAQK